MPPALTGRARSEGRSRPLASAWNQNQLVVDPYDRVSLLALEPHPRLLEFGCGPGLALDSILPAAGIAVALDHSPQMIRMAQKRHAGAVREERLQLILADVIEFARCYSVEGFDRLFSSNVVQFWPDLEVGFRAGAAGDLLDAAGGAVDQRPHPRRVCVLPGEMRAALPP